MKTIFNKTLIVSAICIGAIIWSSCKEKTITPGSLIPEVDNIHTFSEEASFFEPSLHVALKDSLKTSDYKNYIAGVGKVINDPVFGSVTSSLFIQFVPPTAFYSFPSGLTFDSASVILPFAGLNYGDISSPATNFIYLNVFEIKEPFNKTQDYFSFQSLQYGNQSIGGGGSSLNAITDTTVSIDTLVNQLRIPLNQTFAQSIFNADAGNFVSAGSFFELFKGMYIVPKDTIAAQNRISYFKLLGESFKTSARMAFYCHDAEGKPQVIEFPFNANTTAFFNKITRNYSGTPSESFINGNQNRDSVLIQGYPGLHTEITLKNIDKIPNSIINQAQIIVTSLNAGNAQIYTSPVQLILEIKDSSGHVNPIADVYGNSGMVETPGLDFMDGRGKAITINGQTHTRYTLNFPRALQQAMMKGEKEITFRISAVSSFPGAFRLLAGGFSGPMETQLKANIIYTKQ